MLLLVTIGLVVVGAVSLVIGFVSNSLPPIYLSIACSVIAGVVLVVFSRMSKRQEAGGPAATGYAPAPAGAGWAAPSPPSPAPPPPLRTPSPRPPTPTSPATAPSPAPAAAAPAATAVAVDDDFPIEGYDTMRVSQILPALEQLDLDDLDYVREREEQGKNRTTVLRRIDTLITEREAEEDFAPAPAMAAEPVEDEEAGEDTAGELVDLEAEGLGEMEEFRGDEDDEQEVAEVGATDRTEVMTAAVPDGRPFPIPDYDRLPVAQILPLLDDLTDEELDMVVEREEQGKNRAAILDRIDDMFEPVEEEFAVPMPPPPPAPPPAPAPVVSQPAPAKKAPAKKAGTAKAPAKKAPAKVATKAAGKTAKVPAKSATKTPARASVKKAAVQKAAPVAKPSPVKAPPPAKTAGKKSPAKAAAPAKKVAKKG